MQTRKLIKKYRENRGISINTLSNHIGISRTYLSQVENGHQKPSEKLLRKIISVLNLNTHEATLLLSSAGLKVSEIALQQEGGFDEKSGEGVIDRMEIHANGNSTKPKNAPKGLQVRLKEDMNIIFTDIAIINSNPNGVVINFGQTVGGPISAAEITTRVGMSLEHAKSLLKALENNLQKAEASAKK